jgi:glycosyltransferase involved in cell wall biosynthesis
MKICILAPRFPFPENGGDLLRINNISKYLKSMGHTVILVTYYTSFEREKYHAIAERFYDKIYYVKRSDIKSFVYSLFALLSNKPIQIGYYFSFTYLLSLKNIVKSENPDLFVSHLLRMVPYLNLCHLHDRSIIEMTDALSRIYRMSKKSARFHLKKIIYQIEINRIKKYETQIANKYKKCILVSEADKNYLSNKDSIYVYKNGIYCLPLKKTKYNVNKIVFVGNMRTLQNQDAVYYFTSDVFPIIKQKIPDAIFYIIGAEPSLEIRKLDDGKNIIVSGFVESVEEAIKDAVVAVAPVRIAAGIQNKVLVSMACGIPVVLSSLISVGITGLVSGKNSFISDTKNEFAHIVISLMTNRELRNKIGKAGYELVKTEYSWDKQLKGYEEGVV